MISALSLDANVSISRPLYN
jgi:hypothetical protein